MLESVPSGGSPNPAEQVDQVGAAAIEELIGKAEQSQDDGRAFMQPKTSGPKKKNGRPRKNPDDPKWREKDAAASGPTAATGGDPAGAPAFDTAAACKMLFSTGSGLLVRKTKCDQIALSPDEVNALGDAWGKVLDKYLPGYLNQHGELITALSVTGMVGWRIKSALEAEIERRKAEAARPVDAEVSSNASVA